MFDVFNYIVYFVLDNQLFGKFYMFVDYLFKQDLILVIPVGSKFT